ncbi:ATP-binding protein [Actinacidiphila glaucinigra]|uniref:ATP-binding protein n=1 Tax=Actinacidiphila glaucinigra TaxID=235986 RepID=UPI0035D7E093
MFWFMAVCLIATTGAALHWWLAARAERRRVASLEQSLLERNEEARHLVVSRLPAAAEAADNSGVLVSPVLHPLLLKEPFGRDLEAVTLGFTTFVKTAQTRADRAAQASLASAMKAMQGLANEQQRAISAMQDRYDDPEVLQGLLEVDHMNAQIGRRAQAIAVLSGSWPGRQRASSPVLAVVRGATSRIRDYRRVQIRGQGVDVSVISRAVEPAVLAVAELLDNAARHSQPNTPIEVSIQSGHNGVSIVIDDCGVGMLEDEMRQATELLSGERSVDVTRLGDPPAFGHAVVGRLTARYGFRAFADSASPFGGLRAVIFLPSSLLTSNDPAMNSSTPQAVRPEREPHPATASSASPVTNRATAEKRPAPVAVTEDGLPQRRRRQPATERTQAAAGTPQARPVRTAEQDAAALGAFQRGTRAARAIHTLQTNGPSVDGAPDDTERLPQQ